MALSGKQRAFIEHYLSCLNASEAARRAGYSVRSAGSIGEENLKKPEIAAEVKRRTEEMAMGADEVLAGIAEHARGSMADFYTVDDDGNPVFDLRMAADAGKLHLIKKLETKTTTFTLTGRSRRIPATLRAVLALPVVAEDDEGASDEKPVNEVSVTEVSVKLELYDRLHARELMGRHHKLFKDSLDVNHTGLGFNADDAAKAEEEMKQWREQRNSSGNTSSG